jgi:anti-sigma28 factor (negative regulator of flagellin synthesis)
MRIYDTNPQAAAGAANTLETQRLESSGGKVSITGPSKPGEPSDEVQLSTLGSRLAAEAAAPERDAHVARIAALYQSGAYHVDAEAVSQRIIDDSTSIR